MANVCYHNPRCATSRKVMGMLDGAGEHPELMQRPIIDTGRRAFLARPPARAQAWLEGKRIR